MEKRYRRQQSKHRDTLFAAQVINMICALQLMGETALVKLVTEPLPDLICSIPRCRAWMVGEARPASEKPSQNVRGIGITFFLTAR